MNISPGTIASPPAFWSCLDGVAIINLDDRPERWEATIGELAAFPQAPKPARIAAVRGVDLPGFGVRPWFRGRPTDQRWAARAGCTQSHRKAMLHARAHAWQTFLVLEDDACLKPLADLDLHRLQRALFHEHSGWDVCYLGFSKAVGQSLEVGTVAHHTLCEVTGCYTTHAYLVRARARDWIIAQLPEDSRVWAWHAQHRIIDRWYVRHLSRHWRVFALTPSLITQRAGFSDIVQRQVDYVDEFGGRLVRSTTSRTHFDLCKKLSHGRFACADSYDLTRGTFKRLNGF